MPQKITEVAFVPMVPEADLTDLHNYAHKIVLHGCKVTRSQSGYERGVWGVVGQNPQIWCTLTDWDDISSHIAYTKSPVHDLELESIAKICNSPIELFHVPMRYAEGTTVDTKMSSPIIDVVTGYFPVDKAKALMHEGMDEKFLAKVISGYDAEKSLPRPSNCAFGWAVEDDGPVFGLDGTPGGREGKGIEKPWCGLFGWDTVDQGEDFVKEATDWIEQMGGERIMVRARFSPYEAAFDG